jgi:aromatic-L-amino-acid decarboxylase
VDPLPRLGALCRQHHLWFHVDGAYGGFAVLSHKAPSDLRGLREADSLVVDPHKWLYMPADIGCLLTRDRRILYDTFHQGAPYYAESDEQSLLGGPETLQFRDLGPQTTRSLRALKVRLFLQCVGRDGYARMLDEDMQLARRLHELVSDTPSLEALTQELSITTFRYVPRDLAPEAVSHQDYLNALNREILHRIQDSGLAYPSHTSLQGLFALRVCVVNYNTTLADIEALPRVVCEVGAELDAKLRPAPR